MSSEGPAVDRRSYEALRIERDGDVLCVTIDHPTSALNAVDDLLHGELTRLFADLKREDQARAVLLTGAGRAFSAGGDLPSTNPLLAPLADNGGPSLTQALLPGSPAIDGGDPTGACCTAV